MFGKSKSAKCNNKVRYSSDPSAQEALKRINPGRATNKPNRVYRCPDCSGWHLSSQPKR